MHQTPGPLMGGRARTLMSENREERPLMKKYLVAAVAALALAFIGIAVADTLGPPPPIPQYRCNPPAAALMWGSFGASFLQGYVNTCRARYNAQMQRWQAQMQYWQAMRQYQQGGQ